MLSLLFLPITPQPTAEHLCGADDTRVSQEPCFRAAPPLPAALISWVSRAEDSMVGRKYTPYAHRLKRIWVMILS